jgi:hypothetical protein
METRHPAITKAAGVLSAPQEPWTGSCCRRGTERRREWWMSFPFLMKLTGTSQCACPPSTAATFNKRHTDREDAPGGP